jgi:hypothetical protein
MAGTFVAVSVWMMRYAMQQQRQIAERFIQHLERLLERQQEDNRLNRSAVRELAGAVRRNSQLVSHLLKVWRGEREGLELTEEKQEPSSFSPDTR